MKTANILGFCIMMIFISTTLSNGATLQGKDFITLTPGGLEDHGDDSITGTIAWALSNYNNVMLMPGEYILHPSKTLTVSAGQSLVGSGKFNTLIKKESATSYHSILMTGEMTQVSNLGLEWTRSRAYHHGLAALKIAGNSNRQTVNNVYINATGIGAAGIFLGTAQGWLNNVEIVTEGVGIGIRHGGQWYFDGCDIVLIGDDVGCDHIGIRAESSGGRIHWFGGRIGCGYGYDDITGDTDKMICAMYIASNLVEGSRFTFFGLNSFTRMQDGCDDPDQVSVYRDDSGNGWARFFGCFGQAEIPSGAATNDGCAIINNQGGKVETYGCRFTRYNGEVLGTPQVGVRTISSDAVLEKFEGGWILLDGSSNAVTVDLPWEGHCMKGAQYWFKCIDATNTVTIGRNGNTIDGGWSHITLSTGDTVKLFYDGSGWWTE